MKSRISITSALVVMLLVAVSVPPRVATSAPVWHELGPALGGRLDGIVASPADANQLLVASPGGGVWRTYQGGGDWQPAPNYGLADYSVFHLEWDRTNANRLLAVTWSDLYASVDLGDTWADLTGLGGVPAPLMPSDHGADPKPFAQLTVSRPMAFPVQAVILWGKPCSGLFYSYDGVTFTQHWPFAGGSLNPDNCLQAITADDLTGQVYFSTMGLGDAEPAHVYVSTCAWTETTPCLTWQLANTNLPTGVTVPSLTWTGVANRVAAAMKPSPGAASTGLFVTNDGNSWTATAAVPFPSWDPRPLAWAGSNQLFLGTVVPYQTTDLGGTWSSFSLPNGHLDTRAVFWHTYDPLHSYLWTTTDGADTGAHYNITRWNWSPGSAPSGGAEVSYHGLRVWQPYYVAVASQPSPPKARIFLGTQDNSGLCSDDRGTTWTEVGAPSSLGCGDYNSLVFAPSNPNRAYARTCTPGFARTGNALAATACSTVSWTEVTPPQGPYPPAFWTRAMTAVHPTDLDRVYFASGRNVAISSDAGNTLSLAADFPGGGAYPVSLYVDSAGSIYAGTMERGAFLSTDNGTSWTPWGLNSPAPRVVMNIAYSSAAAGTFFMATTDGLYRLLPGGAWTRMPAAFPGYTVSDVEVDPGCPHRIYAALGFVGGLGVHRGGVLVSTDNGTTWASITAGLTLHQAPISDVQVDPSNSRYLYAAVYGQGAWEYDQGQAPACPPLVDTPIPTITNTPSSTPTLMPTNTPSQTPSRTTTSTPTNTSTPTLSPTATITPAPSATETGTPTATVTATHTATPTTTGTLLPTETPTPSSTPILTVTQSPAATATATAPVACTGDCRSDGAVTVDELLALINIALGNALATDCTAGDSNHDAEITIDEILAAVNNALTGCE